MNKLEELYRAVWKQMLGGILGWSELEVCDWAKKYDNYLQNPEDIFYHEDPPYWAVSACVPVQVSQNLSPDQRCRVKNEILSIFPVELYAASYLGIDWKQYKNKIDSIIDSYAR